RLGGRVAGEHEIRASHEAHRPVATALALGAGELLVVDLRLARTVARLGPLTITARARDPRHDASYEGLYARRSDFPRVGSRRAVLHTAPEMRSMRVRDVLRWMEPRLRRRSGFFFSAEPEDELPGCWVVYWNGRMVRTAL